MLPQTQSISDHKRVLDNALGNTSFGEAAHALRQACEEVGSVFARANREIIALRSDYTSTGLLQFLDSVRAHLGEATYSHLLEVFASKQATGEPVKRFTELRAYLEQMNMDYYKIYRLMAKLESGFPSQIEVGDPKVKSISEALCHVGIGEGSDVMPAVESRIEKAALKGESANLLEVVQSVLRPTHFTSRFSAKFVY